jgi:hypothetical protein
MPPSRHVGQASLRKPKARAGISSVVQEENKRQGSRTLGRPGGTTEGQKHCPHLEGFLSFNLGRGSKLQRSKRFLPPHIEPSLAVVDLISRPQASRAH